MLCHRHESVSSAKIYFFVGGALVEIPPDAALCKIADEFFCVQRFFDAYTQQTRNICITFIDCRHNVFDVDLTLCIDYI